MSGVVQIETAETLDWPAARRAEVDEALSHYPNRRSAILPVMWIAQREWGWLSPAASPYGSTHGCSYTAWRQSGVRTSAKGGAKNP